MKRAPISLSPLLAIFFALALISFSATAELQAQPVNINEADAETLAEQLSGIGPKKAEAIINFRNAEGDFVTVEHLEEVRGIGMTTVENNRDRLTVD